MTVLDIGAHHGLYTLLAVRKVGPKGRVIAFEPSPRERRCLNWNLRINRCKNVKVEPFALGAAEGAATLFVVEGDSTGCNSLRPPEVSEPTAEQSVEVRRLDRVLEELAIQHVDFIKLDAEGAELDILRGSGDLVEKEPRPVLLVEVYDIRTHPWGYDASEIIRFLAERDYVWFRLLVDGVPELVGADRSVYDDNFVAVPRENSKDATAGFSGGSVAL
jgi:FkbM family methyltransferase